MASDDYPGAETDVKWMAEQAFIDVIKTDLEAASIVGTNVRHPRDSSTDRSAPTIVVDCFEHESALWNQPEYMLRMQLHCETHETLDDNGSQLSALVGYVQALLKRDNLPNDTKSRWFVTTLNQLASGIRFHDIREGVTFQDDTGKIRRMIVEVEAWCYPYSAA